jgi:hypothetical protein
MLVVALTLVFGWQAAPGETERGAAGDLLVLVSRAGLDALPGGGALAWAVFVPVLGSLGVAALSAARLPVEVRVGVCGFLALVGVPLENPRLVAPVASVPPDPVRDTLTTLEPGRMIAFPAPQASYRQGQRPEAALFWEAASAGQRVEREGADPAAAGVIGALSARAEVPVDEAAARLLWDARTDDPLGGARTAGWRYLLVDLDALPALGRPRIEGWLVEQAGTPVSRDGSRLLYDLGTK